MDDLNEARLRYAQKIVEKAGLTSQRLIRAFAEVPREDFLGPGPWKILLPENLWQYRDTADDNPFHLYGDVLVALDPSRLLNNGLPSGLARWLDALDLQEGQEVVHAGCGTGYYTAIVAHVVGPGGKVIAIEFDPDLAARARANLNQYHHVQVVAGSAVTYDPSKVDAIFINAGATHPVPLWLDSLKPQGRLLFPLIRWEEGGKFGSGISGLGVMMLVQHKKAAYCAKLLGSVGIFPCVGALDIEADRLLGEAFGKMNWTATPMRGGLAGTRSFRRDSHDADSTCLLHGSGYCFSKA
jgi:protein-L-isoaspartate(D-aspartate) O-methyltransferase